MSTTTAKPATTPMPVQLSEPEFTAFLLPVWLKYCVTSRGLSMRVAEQSTKALPPALSS